MTSDVWDRWLRGRRDGDSAEQRQDTLDRLFHRVPRPDGRISLWEPINAHGFPEPENRLLGFDTTPVADLGSKVKQVYRDRQPPEDSTMLDFDERDLLAWADAVGFVDLHLVLEIGDRTPEPAKDWEAFLDSSPNPLAPTWREAVGASLNASEAGTFLEHLRPLAEAREGRWRHAAAHLTARTRVVVGQQPYADARRRLGERRHRLGAGPKQVPEPWTLHTCRRADVRAPPSIAVANAGAAMIRKVGASPWSMQPSVRRAS